MQFSVNKAERGCESISLAHGKHCWRAHDTKSDDRFLHNMTLKTTNGSLNWKSNPSVPTHTQTFSSYKYFTGTCGSYGLTNVLAFVSLGHPEPAGNKHGGNEEQDQQAANTEEMKSRTSSSYWQSKQLFRAAGNQT